MIKNCVQNFVYLLESFIELYAMKKLYKSILFAIIFLSPFLAFSQSAAKNDKEQEPKSTRSQRKSAKKEWKDRRRSDRAEKKKIKDHHKRLQTKEVRKRMKKDKKKARKNDHH